MGRRSTSWRTSPRAFARFHAFGEIEVRSPHGLQYEGKGSKFKHLTVVRGDAGDFFRGDEQDETFEDERGDDRYVSKGGSNTFLSRKDDADTFRLGDAGTMWIRGFNGAGKSAGDRIDFDSWLDRSDVRVSTKAGQTVLGWDGGRATVDAKGVAEGIDCFFG